MYYRFIIVSVFWSHSFTSKSFKSYALFIGLFRFVNAFIPSSNPVSDYDFSFQPCKDDRRLTMRLRQSVLFRVYTLSVDEDRSVGLFGLVKNPWPGGATGDFCWNEIYCTGRALLWAGPLRAKLYKPSGVNQLDLSEGCRGRNNLYTGLAPICCLLL